jgi:DNA invertase Pin-like site-specific DNA recombinase
MVGIHKREESSRAGSKIGIYIRVSSIKQEDGESLDTQRDAGIEFAQAEGVSYIIYQDSASSKVGSKARQGYMQLQSDIETGKIDTVAFFKINRLGRDDVAGLIFLRFLIQYRVSVYDTCLQRYIDLSDPAQLFALKLGFLLSNKDNDEKASTVLKNLHHQFDAGERRYSGRLYGYYAETVVEEKVIKGRKISKIKRTWHIQEDEAKLIRYVFSLAIDEKLGLSAICRRLAKEHYKTRAGKPWSHDKIRLILRHPQYAGMTTTSEGIPRESLVYDEIVPVEQWKLMQARYPDLISSNRKGRPNERFGSGLLECVRCGSRYSHWDGWGCFKKADGTVSRYPKINYLHNARTGCGGQMYYMAEIVEFILRDAFYSAIFHSEEILKRLKGDTETTEDTEEVKRLAELLKTNKKAIDDLFELTIKGVKSDTVAPKVMAIETECEEIKASIEALEAKIRNGNALYAEARYLFSSKLNEDFQVAEEKEQNRMLKLVIKQVKTDRASLEVEYIDGSIKKYDYAEVRETIRKSREFCESTRKRTMPSMEDKIKAWNSIKITNDFLLSSVLKTDSD